MTSNFNDLDLTIDLPTIKLGMVREEKFYGPFRERVTGEKYFRQAIYVFNEEGKYTDSGFVQINDYTDMCRMVKVCNKSKKTFHLFERWEHYGSDFYKTPKFTVTDLVTGNTVEIVEDSYVPTYTKNMNTLIGECCCLVGDLEKDEYSKVLIECLNEYSDLNKPPTNQAQAEEIKENCDCNLFEKLEILDLFRSGDLDEERRDKLFDSLVCNCKNKTLDPELTEEQQAKRDQLRLKAQAEIAGVFAKKKE
jgi:hypothetical protein